VEAGVQVFDAREGLLIRLSTLTDGGQPAEQTAQALADFVAAAQHTLEVAIYDFHLPDDLARIVEGALAAAAKRGVAVRLAYNVDHDKAVPVPPPPGTKPELVEALPFPTAPIPGVPDLMHHKYVIRDQASVWTGSTNWTHDSWTREENVIVTVDSAELAGRYGTDFEQLWTRRDVLHSGKVDTTPLSVDGTAVRAWFCPGRGDRLAHRIAKAIGTATRRIRIASPVISSGPILGTLAQVVSDGKVDLAGVVDQTQVHEVLRQWEANGNVSWKEPLLRTTLTKAPFSGKRSTPYGPGTVHDFMHAKVTVADDIAFVGSFNLSHSGELNAENVLEIADAGLAERLAAFVDQVRGKYPPVEL
jgi:phosphatidylserine/phosphatidylglycerophosphate/cardiolipin synthase-like enzyme